MRIPLRVFPRARWIGVVVGIFLMCSASSAQDQLVISETDGEFIGQKVAFRVLKQAYQQAGIQIVVKDYPAERSVVSANDGSTDGVLARMAGLETKYANLVRVPVPVAYLEMVVFAKRVDFPVTGWESLRPYRITYMRGNKLAEQHPAGMKAETVSTPEQAFKKLAADRTDVVVEARDAWCLAKSADRAGIRVLEPPLERLSTYHYLHKRHKAVVSRLEAILKQMEEQNQITRTMDDAIEECMSRHESQGPQDPKEKLGQ